MPASATYLVLELCIYNMRFFEENWWQSTEEHEYGILDKQTKIWLTSLHVQSRSSDLPPRSASSFVRL